MTPTFEFSNGQMVEVDDLVLTESTTVSENVTRTIVIKASAHVTTTGHVSGTVNVSDGVLDAYGSVSGTVSVSKGSRATFHDRMSGSLAVARGATAHLTHGATALGSMRIDGILLNDGVRGEQVSGSGSVEDRPGSTVRKPDEVAADGTIIYRN